MIKYFNILLISLFTFLQCFSQQLNIKGRIVDTTQTGLPLASIFLLDPADSSLIDYTRTEDDGHFSIKNIKSRDYLIKVNYVGYLPQQIFISKDEGPNVDLGIIVMKPISKELFEIVIKAARAPMMIRGDTIEYDASTFKVPPGSTLEDLLRRLPGIEVGSDGNIKTEGRDITKVTVEGKLFFGDDPKSATKNIPAEGVKKVQVFNEVKEEEKLTGVASGPPSKAMNIELKEEFKKGGFGKIIVGGGNEERGELKGNFNKFNKKEQFSIVLALNNTGRNGLSWNDYQDFKGSNSFNWDDNTDFGFGSGGRRYIRYIFSDEDDDFQDIFFGNTRAGFPKKAAAGLNYNYDVKQIKFSGSYIYNFTNLTSTTHRLQQFFIPDRDYNTDDLFNKDFNSNNQKGDLRFEYKIDSLNTLMLLSSISFGETENKNDGVYSFKNPEQQTINELSINSNSTNNIVNSQNSLVYRKKFSKQGRNLGISAGYLLSTSDKDADQNSLNNYYLGSSTPDSISALNQLHLTLNSKRQYKSSGIYVEPLVGNFFWQTFYNLSHRTTDIEKDVYNTVESNTIVDSLLSQFSENTVDVYRLGSSIRYSYQGRNFSMGIAREKLEISGNYITGLRTNSGVVIAATYGNWIPNINIELELRKNQYMNAGYSVYIKEPAVRDLIPIIDNSNPSYIRQGNPNLQPEIVHEINASYYKFDPVNFNNINGSINYTINSNSINSFQVIDTFNNTTSSPINFGKENSLWISSGYGFPIQKNKITLNFSGSFNISDQYTLINNEQNEISSYLYSFGSRLNLTPNDILSFFLTSNIQFSNSKSSNVSLLNNNLVSQNYSAELNYKMPLRIYFNSNFNLNLYQNKDLKQEQTLPLLNLSLYKVFLKGNKGELRLSVYDVFNKNLGINQSISANQVTQSQTLTLARYALLSFSYNMRGIKTQIKKNNRWGD